MHPSQLVRSVRAGQHAAVLMQRRTSAAAALVADQARRVMALEGEASEQLAPAQAGPPGGGWVQRLGEFVGFGDEVSRARGSPKRWDG